ncbi:hypothetical protein H5410_025921 [Solanum commersonii]|uniref:Uncharacterized protein n=1 Tax=Solanum commersonii TaxID=4109 RepID=A0A9J5YX81_SOLCO|nr:hypothetical protein H5410_025921 [Solanum commersonii]
MAVGLEILYPKINIRLDRTESIWNELWIGEEDLKTTFPDLYILSLQQMDMVTQLWSPQGWNLTFRRALNDWEINRVADFLQILYAFPGTTVGPDLPNWKLHSKGSFTESMLNSRSTTEKRYPNLLKEWGEEDHKKIGGEAFRHVSGGPYRKKEMKDAMMEKLAVSKRSR